MGFWRRQDTRKRRDSSRNIKGMTYNSSNTDEWSEGLGKNLRHHVCEINVGPLGFCIIPPIPSSSHNCCSLLIKDFEELSPIQYSN